MTGVTHETSGNPRDPLRPRAGSRVGVLCSAVLVGALAASALGVLRAEPAHAGATETYLMPGSRTFQLSGLGYGHGIGMSQFGAEGMGRLGKSYRQIVKFYYPGSSLVETDPGREISVGLSGVVKSTHQGNAVVVLYRPELSASNDGSALALPRRVGGAPVSSYRVVRSNDGLSVFAVSKAKTSKVKGGMKGAITWRADDAVGQSRVAVSTAAGTTRTYRGFLQVKKGSSSVLAISRLLLEDYLRSVVSHEVPSSWTGAALRAQAVAARSYALLSQVNARAANRPYDICDSTSCQAFGPIGGESGPESRAVRATRGVYLRSGGQPVLAMYSSANGGYTVSGGRPYLVAKPDPYDGVVTGTANWGHEWKTSVSAASIERSWPQIGRLQKLRVLGRDGNGEWGGRVLSVGLIGSKSTVTVSADSFRWASGIKSTWWTVTNADSNSDAPAKNVRVKRADRSAVIRWRAPDTDRRVKGYRVTVSKTDDSYRVGSDVRRLRVRELTNGREYRAAVQPIYRSGPGPKSRTPAFVPWSTYSYYRGVAVKRVVARGETASQQRGGQFRALVVGHGLAPTSGTRAVAIRVYTKSLSEAGRVKVWPCGDDKRDQVAVTYPAGQANSGVATVPVASNGRLCFGATSGLAAVDVDVLGYYTASGVGTAAFRAIAAERVASSESGKGWTSGRLTAGEPRTVRVAGRGSVPEHVRTVLLSVGLVNPTADSTLSVAPPGTPPSLGMVVRGAAGSWRTGTIVARLDDRGRLPLRLTEGKADVHVEVLGWFSEQSGSRAGRFKAMKATSIWEPSDGPLSDGAERNVRVRGGDTGVPGGASAVVVQVLASGRGGSGYLTLQPTGSAAKARPLVTFQRKGTARSMVVVPVGDEARVRLVARGSDADVSLRIVGWYS